MTNDPKGFDNIAWGSALSSRPELEIVSTSPHVKEYRFKEGPTSFGNVAVDSIQFSSFDNQFARVTIRYRAEAIHKKILAYLEREFGTIDRIPGQMVRGLDQQYTWQGQETEINLTYHGGTERDYIFIDSRNLAPRFNDLIGDSAE